MKFPIMQNTVVRGSDVSFDIYFPCCLVCGADNGFAARQESAWNDRENEIQIICNEVCEECYEWASELGLNAGEE